MDFIELLKLVEKGRERFYAHVLIHGQSERGELQFLLGKWTYRPIAYEGKWIKIKSPDLVEQMDLASVRTQITQTLLTEYCYYELVTPGENEIRKYSLKNYFGTDICNNSLEEMKMFQESLTIVLEKMQKPKLTLI